MTLATDRMFVKEASVPSKWMLLEYIVLGSYVSTNLGTAKRKFGISCEYQMLFRIICFNLAKSEI